MLTLEALVFCGRGVTKHIIVNAEESLQRTDTHVDFAQEVSRA